jgi:biofilm protein TabA
MISDVLRSTTSEWLEHRYATLATVFQWLRAMPSDAPDGITQLAGDDFYVNVHGYATKPAEECRWESHRRTVDVQYCISGGELIHWTPTGTLDGLGDYVEPPKDVEHWRDSRAPATVLRMTPGRFVIFLPNELHRPKVIDGTHPDVRKLVVKIGAHRLGL